MKRLLFCCVVAICGVGGLAGIGQAVPDWSVETGFDFWSLPRINRQLERENQRSATLDEETGITFTRMAAKQKILDELVANRISLREAATRFRNLSTLDYLTVMQLNHPGASDDELFYCQVIDYLRHDFTLGEARGRILADLEAELDRDRRQDGGTIRLP